MLASHNACAHKYKEAQDQAVKAALIQAGFTKYAEEAKNYFKNEAYKIADQAGMKKTVAAIGYIAITAYKKQAVLKLKKNLILHTDAKNTTLTLTIQF